MTQKGEEFVEFAKRHQELNRQIQDWSRGDVTEVLRVASVISLTDYVKGFYRELLGKGKLSITLATHWTDRIISMLENRETDIGITPRVFYSKAVEAVPIFQESLYLVSSRSVSSYPDFIDAKTLKRAMKSISTGEQISSNGTKTDESSGTPTDGHGHNRITPGITSYPGFFLYHSGMYFQELP